MQIHLRSRFQATTTAVTKSTKILISRTLTTMHFFKVRSRLVAFSTLLDPRSFSYDVEDIRKSNIVDHWQNISFTTGFEHRTTHIISLLFITFDVLFWGAFKTIEKKHRNFNIFENATCLDRTSKNEVVVVFLGIHIFTLFATTAVASWIRLLRVVSDVVYNCKRYSPCVFWGG